MLQRFPLICLTVILNCGAAALLTGCVTPPTPTDVRMEGFDVQSLYGSDWTVVAVNGIATITDPAPQLRWMKTGDLAGSGGCNSFVGKFTYELNTLKIGALAATRMLCVPTPQGQEDKFFKALEMTQSAKVLNGELRLMGTVDTELMRLRQK